MSLRRILLIAHRVPPHGQFSLNDLAGGGGRMDEVARAVSTAFTFSNGLRSEVEMTILFVAQPPPASRRIRIRGEHVRYLNPDERSTAALLKNALTRPVGDGREVASSPGLTVGRADPLADLARAAEAPDVIWLREDGTPLREFRPDLGTFTAILSDDQDLSEAEAGVLNRTQVPRVSLGPQSLRASQCIDVLHNEFDLREARAAAGPLRRTA